ncbi:MAG: Crp/Fnr family transcriptional regulator [Candidatus Polarisedimenticolia bacterium]|nr:Crp/Fnr family transcriptional regulator [bacterium]
MPTVDDLARSSFFSGLAPQDLAALAAIAVRRRHAAGKAIFRQGQQAAGLHLVAEGRVKVFRLGADGREQLLHVWGPGEPFGEVAVLEGGDYPATAAALDDCRTVLIPRPALLDLVARRPEFALRFMAVLARRLRDFAAQIEALTTKEAPARLAAHLLRRDAEAGGTGLVALELPKNQLANLLGATPETFSRCLKRMTEQGLVAAEGTRGLRILDRAGLAAMAEGR